MQNALTVIAPIRPGHLEDLQKLLVSVGGEVAKNGQIDFSRLPMIHFARWVIVGGPGDAAGGPSRLIFGTDHDGEDAALLAALHHAAAPLLAEIYGHCEGVPADLGTNAAAFADYMLRRRIGYNARHIAYRNHAVGSVKNALELRDAVETYLDQSLAGGKLSPIADPIAAAGNVLGFIRNNSPVAPRPSPPASNPTKTALSVVGLLLLAALVALGIFNWKALLGLLLLLVLLVLAFWATLRAHETRDAREWTPPPPVIDARELLFGEDRVVQNQMTHFVPIKKGWFRRTTLRLVLWAINLLAAVRYTNGTLGGIPTIHFARWMVLDGGERLLFFSNFDGSWERYLGDFVDQAHAGLTGVWSNTIGFPPARGLVNEGASNVDVFKSWTRQYQIPTQVWYSAYPTSTVTNIRNAIALRDEIGPVERALTGPQGAAMAEAWLLRL